MAHVVTPNEALTEAVARLGGQSALARLCGKAQPTVWSWVQNSKPLPAEFVLRVEAATGVSRHLLRPDIYPIEETPAPRFHGVDRPAADVSRENGGNLQAGDE